MQNRRLSTQVVLGVLVVLIGFALLAETTGFSDIEVFWTYVPSLFVLLGVYAIVASGFRNVIGPVVVVIVAGAWQLVTLGYLSAGEVTQLWPLLIVLFGVSLVLGQYRSRARSVEGSYVHSVGLFGGSEKRVTGLFTGADLTALFGGTALDLRDATLEDRPVHVATTTLFGGTEVVVPREWNVQVDALPLFGASEDERPRTEREHEGVDVVVTGLVLFGGLSVTD
jgi:hypothetical protein